MEGVIIKRLMMNRSYGIIVLTEGLIELMSLPDVLSIFGEYSLAKRGFPQAVADNVMKYVL